MTIYPTLTVWQPWATLIAIGAKPLEYRGWELPTRLIGQRVAVHAGARPVKKDEVRELLLHLQSSFWRETGLLREPAIKLLTDVLMSPGALPRSSIVCLATMGKAIRNGEMERRMGLPVIADSDRTEHTNWGWPLLDIQPLEPPLPARGAQGWWHWTAPDDIRLGRAA
mgnify:CR=1 FL=1